MRFLRIAHVGRLQGKKGQRYYMYRCPPVGDCPQRVTISAPEVEKAVTAVVQTSRDLHGSAADDVGISEAVDQLSRTKQALDAAVQTFTGMEDVPSTREKLHELRDARDAAQSRVDDLRAAIYPRSPFARGTGICSTSRSAVPSSARSSSASRSHPDGNLAHQHRAAPQVAAGRHRQGCAWPPLGPTGATSRHDAAPGSRS